MISPRADKPVVVKKFKVNRLFHDDSGAGFKSDNFSTDIWLPGDFTGDFTIGMQLLLGYLSDTWKNFRRDFTPRLIREFDMTDAENGSFDFGVPLAGMPFLRVQVDITFLPVDEDLYFGEPEILHAGWFAFAAGAPNLSVDASMFAALQGGIFAPAFSRLQYLNFGRMSFFPQSPEETAFFVKLKPGVKAHVTVYGANYPVFEEADCRTMVSSAALTCDTHPDNWSNVPPIIGSYCPLEFSVGASVSYQASPLADYNTQFVDTLPGILQTSAFENPSGQDFEFLPPTTNKLQIAQFANYNPLAVIGFDARVIPRCADEGGGGIGT